MKKVATLAAILMVTAACGGNGNNDVNDVHNELCVTYQMVYHEMVDKYGYFSREVKDIVRDAKDAGCDT